jgi:hypothetical protein
VKGQIITLPTGVRTVIAGSNAAGTAAGDGSVSYPTAALLRFIAPNPTVYLGGSDVSTTTSSVPFVAGENLQLDLVNEILYGIATTTATVYVLRRGD